MKIIIETIPHLNQRYDTVGDWFFDTDGTLHIKVSKLSDPSHEYLIVVHELIEVLLCQHDGVSQEAVDAFDKAFSADRDEEPGDDPGAPYRKQHCFATGVERMLAAELGVDWKAYEQELNDLPSMPEKQ